MPTVYVLSETPKDIQVVARPMQQQPPMRTVGLAWRRHSARSQEFFELAKAIRRVVKSSLPEVTVLE
jgi:hypothetical protein